MMIQRTGLWARIAALPDDIPMTLGPAIKPAPMATERQPEPASDWTCATRADFGGGNKPEFWAGQRIDSFGEFRVPVMVTTTSEHGVRYRYIGCGFTSGEWERTIEGMRLAIMAGRKVAE
jgi:hypothetical protein